MGGQKQPDGVHNYFGTSPWTNFKGAILQIMSLQQQYFMLSTYVGVLLFQLSVSS